MSTTSVFLHIHLHRWEILNHAMSADSHVQLRENKTAHPHDNTSDAFIAYFIKVFCLHLWNSADVP